MNIRKSSAWSEAQIKGFLTQIVIPIRLACLSPDGAPLVCSLWYLYKDDILWCATQQSAAVVRYLESEPRCGFEVAPESPPYKGVRGQGEVMLSLEEGPPLLEQLVNRYLGGPDTDFAQWLLDRRDQEIAIGIQFDWITSWDYSERMQS